MKTFHQALVRMEKQMKKLEMNKYSYSIHKHLDLEVVKIMTIRITNRDQEDTRLNHNLENLKDHV